MFLLLSAALAGGPEAIKTDTDERLFRSSYAILDNQVTLTSTYDPKFASTRWAVFNGAGHLLTADDFAVDVGAAGMEKRLQEEDDKTKPGLVVATVAAIVQRRLATGAGAHRGGGRRDRAPAVAGRMSRRIDPSTLPARTGSLYPATYGAVCAGREKRQLGNAAGLSQFGVNHVRLPPGTWSSQRHWHAIEDEFVYILEGEVWLVTDAGDELLRAGDSAGFPGGVPDGHCLQNRSDADVVYLEVGARHPDDHGEYSDIDMKFGGRRYDGKGEYTRKDGTPI